MYNNRRREKVSDTDLSGSKGEVPVQQYASNYFCKGRKCFFLLRYSSMHSLYTFTKEAL